MPAAYSDTITLVMIFAYALPLYQVQVCAAQVNPLQTGLF